MNFRRGRKSVRNRSVCTSGPGHQIRSSGSWRLLTTRALLTTGRSARGIFGTSVITWNNLTKMWEFGFTHRRKLDLLFVRVGSKSNVSLKHWLGIFTYFKNLCKLDLKVLKIRNSYFASFVRRFSSLIESALVAVRNLRKGNSIFLRTPPMTGKRLRPRSKPYHWLHLKTNVKLE
jgi:hypothetical protein